MVAGWKTTSFQFLQQVPSTKVLFSITTFNKSEDFIFFIKQMFLAIT